VGWISPYHLPDTFLFSSLPSYLLLDIGPFLLPGASSTGVRRSVSVGAGKIVVLV